MKAMILAAGMGQRMAPYTNDIPKPLLKVQGRPLIDYALDYCQQAGVGEVVINVHRHADQIIEYVGDGAHYNMVVHYSDERNELMGTGGGIIKALPLLGDAPFLVLSSDLVTDYPFDKLRTLASDKLAHLVLVNNGEDHPLGDFGLVDNLVTLDQERLTYASIALCSPQLFNEAFDSHCGLGEVLRAAIARSQVTGEYYNGHWYNVGTPALLTQLNERAGRPDLGGCRRQRGIK